MMTFHYLELKQSPKSALLVVGEEPHLQIPQVINHAQCHGGKGFAAAPRPRPGLRSSAANASEPEPDTEGGPRSCSCSHPNISRVLQPFAAGTNNLL